MSKTSSILICLPKMSQFTHFSPISSKLSFTLFKHPHVDTTIRPGITAMSESTSCRLQSRTTKLVHTRATRVSLITHCTLCHHYIRITNALRWDFFDDAISITQHCHLSDNSLSICSSVQSAG